MATIQYTSDRSVDPNGAVIGITWPTLTFTGTDVGAAIQLAKFSDKTFQVFGTLGAAGALLIEGSNDGVNFVPLSNRQGTAMSFVAAGMNTSQDRPVWVRPRITAGDGTTSLTCVAACHRSDLGGIG